MSEDGMGGGQSPFGPGGADLFAEMFRNHQQGGGGGGAQFKTINLTDFIPTRLRWILQVPGVQPLVLFLLALFGVSMVFKFLWWLLSLSMYILPALYLTPAKVRWWLVLLIVLLNLFGFI